MKAYEYDESGAFVAEFYLKNGGELPAMATTVKPPKLSSDYRAKWNGQDWTIERVRPC